MSNSTVGFLCIVLFIVLFVFGSIWLVAMTEKRRADFVAKHSELALKHCVGMTEMNSCYARLKRVLDQKEFELRLINMNRG